MIQLTKNCALDLWLKYKIRVNCVCSGGVYTGKIGRERRKQRYIKYEKDKTIPLQQCKDISNKAQI